MVQAGACFEKAACFVVDTKVFHVLLKIILKGMVPVFKLFRVISTILISAKLISVYFTSQIIFLLNFLVSVSVCIFVKSSIFYFVGTKGKRKSSKKGRNWENLK